MPRGKTVAIDFDRTIAQYDGRFSPLVLGEPMSGAAEFVQSLLNDGVLVWLHTCRTTVTNTVSPWLGTGEFVDVAGTTQQEVVAALYQWLERHGMLGVEVWSGKGKPIADAYIDDRGINFAGDWDAVRSQLEKIW